MKQLIKVLNKEGIFVDWWNSQSASCKFGFFSALVLGFVTHIYIYTNRFINEDDLLLTKTAHNVPSGRWFNNVINNMNYQFVLPVTVGLFQLAFLAVSVFFICKAFEIKKKFNAFLIAGLMCTFPSIAHTNGYLYEGAGYYFAAMLSVLAFFVTIKYKFGFVVGGLLLMLVMAVYQSMVSVALVLCLIYLIILLKDCDFKTLRKNIINFLLLATLGGIFYFISLQVVTFITGISLHDYRGIDEMHVISLSELPQRLLSVYGGFYLFFFSLFHKDIYLYHQTSLSLVIAYIAIILIAALFLVKNYKGIRLVWAVFFLALFPIASNFSSLFDIARLAHVLMIYPFVLIFVFFVILSERTKENILPKRVFGVLSLFIIANFIIISNIHYLQLDIYFQRTLSLTTRILSQIDPLIPYSQSRQIIVIGNFAKNYEYPRAASVFTEQNVREVGLWGSFVGLNAENDTYKLAYILSTRHGTNFHVVPYERYNEIRDKVIAAQMPVFPREGSIAVVDDVIVINISPVAVVTGTLTEKNNLLIETRHTGDAINEGVIYSYFIYRNGDMVKYISTSEPLCEMEIHRAGLYEIRGGLQTENGLYLAEVKSDVIEIFIPSITVNITADGNTVSQNFDITAITKDDDIMVPLRFIAENLGAVVSWCEASGSIYVNYNNKEIPLENIPLLETEGVTLVPLNFITENFNVKTEYNPNNHNIEILAR